MKSYFLRYLSLFLEHICSVEVLCFVYDITMPLSRQVFFCCCGSIKDCFKNLPWVHKWAGLLNFYLLLYSSEPLQFSGYIRVGLLCHVFTATSETYPVRASGQERCIAGGCFVLLCRLLSLSPFATLSCSGVSIVLTSLLEGRTVSSIGSMLRQG